MKTIILIRHAKATDRFISDNDFERCLTEMGRNDAVLVAKELKQKFQAPEKIICSPATRTHQTAEIFAGILNYPLSNIETCQNIYEATLHDLLNCIKMFPDTNQTVALVGHNPAITEIINYLTHKKSIDNLPTSGVAALTCFAKSWKEIEQSTSSIVYFNTPKLIK